MRCRLPRRCRNCQKRRREAGRAKGPQGALGPPANLGRPQKTLFPEQRLLLQSAWLPLSSKGQGRRVSRARAPRRGAGERAVKRCTHTFPMSRTQSSLSAAENGKYDCCEPGRSGGARFLAPSEPPADSWPTIPQ
uniref:Uncharacterized protein n=1 Tax=Myotis myotis TaxID=51298 RepID=A0A7J7ZYD1_MYOMY|nr:hypothetical protein mMyoMyo1_009994 [Myotis myotis]